MTTQVNIKLDDKLKRLAESLAQQLGFSLSSILRAYLIHFTRTRKIDFSITDEEDTPDDLTGEKLEKILVSEGYDPDYAKKHGSAYDKMLEAKRRGTLIEIE